MVTDIYEQYFKAECMANGVQRRAALVKLTADSEAGNVRYTVGVSFFPHVDDEDFAVSYDAYREVEIFSAKGRRSKKREKEFLDSFRSYADSIAEDMDGKIFWDSPIREGRFA